MFVIIIALIIGLKILAIIIISNNSNRSVTAPQLIGDRQGECLFLYNLDGAVLNTSSTSFKK